LPKVAADYGAEAAAYVDAYMKAFSWRGANSRFTQLKRT
jgi:hypothetical protein